MASRTEPAHVVVDGSNIATEGRSAPSLAQLNEAVLAFKEDHPDALITVVVDATFGHRIDPSEVKEFDAAVANNELVAPPAGAVGRGDAFVLGIAHKAKAAVLSNDSFQEFHGEYPWLFDDGRLIGGKPVPHVGWVFVTRVPVRGPVSRKAVKEAKRGDDRRRSGRTPSREASAPLPVPTSPPPGKAAPRAVARVAAPAPPGAPSSSEAVNDVVSFLEFVEHHPVGTSVNATVERYSSHGAYVTMGAVRGYVPLRLMADPPPRSAREVMKVGDSVTVVVESFAPARRSIDCALPHMATHVSVQDPTPVLDAVAADVDSEPSPPPRKKAPAKKASAKKAAATKAPANQGTPKKAPAKKVAAKKVAAKKASATKAPAKKAAVEKAAAKKAAAKKAAAKKAAADKAPATRAPARKAAAARSARPRSGARQSEGPAT